MSSENDRIVVAARSWLGTRFHHQGRLKKTDRHKGGVDCLGLLVGVAGELGLTRADGLPLMALDETDYAHYPDTIRLKQKLSQALAVIPHAGIQAGDILLLATDNQPQHLAIVSDFQQRLGIIHAYAPARCVVEHVLDGYWQERIAAAYRYQ
jgi:cell wall-associated NlpC family hydrolase